MLGVLLLPACSNVPASRANAQANQFQNLLPAAEKGNLEAEDDLGYLYQTGEGTPPDERQAVIWYRRAAEAGYATAERHLAYMYWAGLGLPQDYTQALIGYRRAAQQGDVWAENNIGSMYAAGQGVAPDPGQSQYWFAKAANHRFADAGDFYLALKAVIDAHTQYPPAARAQGIYGTARISFTYPNGKADQAHVEQSSGSTVLDIAALRAVNDSRFPLPPLTGLQNRQYTVSVRFVLGKHP